MSIWPFGQSSSHSDINKILDEYFQVLESLGNNASNDEETIFTKEEEMKLKQFKDSYGSGNNMESKLQPIMEDYPVMSNPNSSSVSLSSSSSSSSSGFSSSNSLDLHTKKPDYKKQKGANSNSENVLQFTKDDLNNSYIEKILNESELLNELSRQNNKLLDFLCYGFFYDSETHEKILNLEYLVNQLLDCCDNININDETLENVDTTTTADQDDISAEEEDEDGDLIETESKELGRATIISEIFSLDIWLVSESLMKNLTYLNKIWSLIKHENFNSEKSPLVSIFIKINQNLLFSRQDDYLQFILQQKTLVDDMVRHIDISMLMDFLLKLIGSDKIESPTGIIDLLSEQHIVQKCLNFLNNEKYHSDIQAYVGDFLKAIIAISANAPLDDVSVGPNELTRELASPESIDQLTQIMIKERGAALNIAVSVVIELIRKNNSDYDQINLLATTIKDNQPTDRDPIYLGYLLRRFTLELPNLFKIILDIETDSTIKPRENQLGELFKPLGFERFKIVELIAELLHCSNMGLMNSKRAEMIATRRDKYRRIILGYHQDEHVVNNLQNLSIEKNNQVTDTALNNFNDETNTINYDNNNNNNDVNDNNDKINNETVNSYGNINNDIAVKNNEESSNELDSYTNIGLEKEDAILEELIQEDDNNGEEVDESFEIPYVNEKQNEKLRTVPTIGDFYKITLYDNRIIPKILVLFLRYPWNNFWHNVIFDIIQQIFNGRMDFSYNSFLVYCLFDMQGTNKFNEAKPSSKQEIDVTNFKITNDFILRGYQESYKFYDDKKMNLGFMGHLVLIAEEVVKFSKLYKVELISPEIFNCLRDEDWQYYSEEVLNDTRMMYSKILGGGTYVDDGNGNIIPQLPDVPFSDNDNNGSPGSSKTSSDSDDDNDEDSIGGGLINVEALEEQLSTESDLHFKLREMLISKSQVNVDEANKKKGVIILGPPSSEDDN